MRIVNVTIVLGLLTSFAAAASIDAVKGRGVATDGAGKNATFNVEVRKTSNGEQSRTVGTFHVNGPNTNIHAERIAQLVVVGKEGKFAGPAVMTRRLNGKVLRVAGKIEVVVLDQTSPKNPTGNPDLLRITFKPNSNGEATTIDAKVTKGDIVVGSRSNP